MTSELSGLSVANANYEELRGVEGGSFLPENAAVVLDLKFVDAVDPPFEESQSESESAGHV